LFFYNKLSKPNIASNFCERAAAVVVHVAQRNWQRLSLTYLVWKATDGGGGSGGKQDGEPDGSGGERAGFTERLGRW